MRYVAAYLLAVLGGHKNITAELITGILQAGGIEADQEKVTFLLKELEGKDINEVLKAGAEKMSKVAASGPAQSGTTTATSTAPTTAPTKTEPVVKKEKTPEPSEEEPDNGLMDFF